MTLRRPSRRHARTLRAAGRLVLLASALSLAACERGSGNAAAPAAPAAPASMPAAALPASGPTSAPIRSAAAPGNIAAALAGTWRQICQPYLPGDGASDITYTITPQGADSLQMAGVAKDYKNTSCAGAGTVIATPQFVQKIVGQAALGGVPVIRLVDEGAAVPAPTDSKSVAGIDQGRLRFGQAKGARDGEGFPTQFEKPADAYNRQ